MHLLPTLYLASLTYAVSAVALGQGTIGLSAVLSSLAIVVSASMYFRFALQRV